MYMYSVLHKNIYKPLHEKTCFLYMGKPQGWDKYCAAGKFQWKMPDNAGTANTPKITEVANTGTYEQN